MNTSKHLILDIVELNSEDDDEILLVKQQYLQLTK